MTNTLPVRGCAALLLVMLCGASVNAENWPEWRGPLGNGISLETGIATEWGPQKNVAWKVPLPGPGGSTPVVWEDRIFLTSSAGDDLVLICISASGEQLWSRKVGTGNQIARRGRQLGVRLARHRRQARVGLLRHGSARLL
ncbi:MAG: PQQ-binding-like beta-propeller repeat protein [Planctomycetaceae bacterium]